MRGGPWVVDVHCYSAFRLHSEHVQDRGVSSYPMLSHTHPPWRAGWANETISGHGSLAGHGYGRCGPIEELDFGHSRSPSGSQPTLRPGLIKGAWSRSLSASPSSSLLLSALRWLLLVASAIRWLFTRGWCATETFFFLRASAQRTLPRAPAK